VDLCSREFGHFVHSHLRGSESLLACLLVDNETFLRDSCSLARVDKLVHPFVETPCAAPLLRLTSRGSPTLRFAQRTDPTPLAAVTGLFWTPPQDRALDPRGTRPPRGVCCSPSLTHVIWRTLTPRASTRRLRRAATALPRSAGWFLRRLLCAGLLPLPWMFP